MMKKIVVVPIAIIIGLCPSVWAQSNDQQQLAPSAQAALSAWKKNQTTAEPAAKAGDKNSTTPASERAKKLRELPKVIVHSEDEQPAAAANNEQVQDFIVHEAPARTDKDLELPWRKPAVPDAIEKREIPNTQAGIPGVTRPALSIVPAPVANNENPIQWQRPRNTNTPATPAATEPAKTEEPKKESAIPGTLQELLNTAKKLPASDAKTGPTPVVLPSDSKEPTGSAQQQNTDVPKKQIALLPPPTDKTRGVIKENTKIIDAPPAEKQATAPAEKPAQNNAIPKQALRVEAPAESAATTTQNATNEHIPQSKVTTVVLDKKDNADATLLGTPIPLRNVVPINGKIPYKTIKLVFLPRLSGAICQNLVQATTMTEQLIASGYVHGLVVLNDDDALDESASQFMLKALSARYNTPILRWAHSDDEILTLMNDLYKSLEKTPGDSTIAIVWDPKTLGTLQHTWVYGLGRAGRITTDIVNKVRNQMPKWDEGENQRWDILSMRWRDNDLSTLEIQTNKAKPAKTFCSK